MAELRQRYQIPRDHVVVGSMGSANHAKRTDFILSAIAALGRKDVIYLLVGEMGASFRRQIGRSELGDLVRVTGYVDAKSFNDYCNLIDVGIDLRNQTMGESSATVCRILAAGKPCVISNFGWFAEIPNDCAVKVDAAADQQTLTRRISELIADQRLRRNIGESARRYIQENHGVERAAGAYVEFLGQVRNLDRRRRVERAIVDETGRAMAELGVGEGDDWLIGGMAEEIAALFRPQRQ
jgi:glycosyltransferase involved in cell wall biosynthesis